MLYFRFKKAFKQCDKKNLNRDRDKYIVANMMGTPVVINRPKFRKVRTKGIFRHTLLWQEVKDKQVTKETLQQWIS
jgi:hypothetical protein